MFNQNNKTQKEQSTFSMLSNINIYKGRHDAVCAAVLVQVAAGVTVLALYVIKGAVGLLLAPASGGASLILCF